MTNYTYQIARVSAKHNFMRVVYSSPNNIDIHQNFNPVNYDKASIDQLIADRVPIVLTLWEDIEAAPELDEVELGVGISVEATYTAPLPPEPPLPPSPEEEIAAALDAQITQIVSMRYVTETGGVVWADAQGDEWFLDTTTESQNRFTGARIRASDGGRPEDAVWKCAKLNATGDPTLAYRPTTNAEQIEWSDLVHDHVQQCFDAEAAAVTKAMAGDVTANFGAEFTALA
jgi:hypothetical protein